MRQLAFPCENAHAPSSHHAKFAKAALRAAVQVPSAMRSGAERVTVTSRDHFAPAIRSQSGVAPFQPPPQLSAEPAGRCVPACRLIFSARRLPQADASGPCRRPAWPTRGATVAFSERIELDQARLYAQRLNSEASYGASGTAAAGVEQVGTALRRADCSGTAVASVIWCMNGT